MLPAKHPGDDGSGSKVRRSVGIGVGVFSGGWGLISGCRLHVVGFTIAEHKTSSFCQLANARQTIISNFTKWTHLSDTSCNLAI